MKKGIFGDRALALALGGNGLFAASVRGAPRLTGKVALVMGSWRADDVTQMQGHLPSTPRRTRTSPRLQADQSADYNARCAPAHHGTAPRLMYARPPTASSSSRTLFAT
jgi:hypothetical protein